MSSDVDHVFKVVSERLPSAGVECLLIGGFAVNHYGYSRNTLDVDLMIAADDIDVVRKIMTDAGFTNAVVRDNVAFFTVPDSQPRVDFLRVDGETMSKLLEGAVQTRVRGHDLKVPALKDLIAMKVFALSQDTERRMGKDLPDIAFLTVLNDLDLASNIRPLCERFGTDAVYELIEKQVEALRTS